MTAAMRQERADARDRAAMARRVDQIRSVREPHNHGPEQQATYDRAAAMFPELPADRLHDWAEQVTHSEVLQAIYFKRSSWVYPFAAEDYT